MNDDCSICTQPIKNKNRILTDCRHSFHTSCLSEWATMGSRIGGRKNPHGFLNNNPSCPLCRAPTIKSSLTKNIIKHNTKLNDAIKYFQDAYLKVRYSGKFPTIFLLPSVNKNSNNRKNDVKTHENMISFLVHILLYNTSRDTNNDNLQRFKKSFLSLIRANNAFVKSFRGSFGINFEDGTFVPEQWMSIVASFTPFLDSYELENMFENYNMDNEVLKTITYFTKEFFDDTIKIMNTKSGNSKYLMTLQKSLYFNNNNNNNN